MNDLSVVAPASADTVLLSVRLMLREAVGVLGPCEPLPALFEEIVRACRGLPVTGARLRRARALQARVRENGGLAALVEVVLDAAEAHETRLLAALLLADAGDVPIPAPGDRVDDLPVALAGFFCPGHAPAFARLCDQLMQEPDDPTPAPASALALLAFLHGLQHHSLADEQFDHLVISRGVLHPAIAPHRSLRAINRLLDYLGFSADAETQRRYRRLVARVWPQATHQNWPCWQWVTLPGGPDLFPRAVRAFAVGERTLTRLHELKFAPIPQGCDLEALLSESGQAMSLLLCLLRPGMPVGLLPGGREALRWLSASNQAAATQAYAVPAWWEIWLRDGWPAARALLGWLQELPLPDVPARGRAEWLSAYLPAYRRFTANLLLAQVASSDNPDAVLELADASDLPAMRALALAPAPSTQMVTLLSRLRQSGARPARQAAEAALSHLAHRRGLPGADELDRQALLAAAWEPGPLDGERVRVGWQDGGYRLRVSLTAGRVALEVLGPEGPLARLPAGFTRREAYREARAAKQEVQATYRRFKERLEAGMVDARPLSGGEFRYLLTNPVFAHLAERLVWRTGDGETCLWSGPGRWENERGEPIDLDARGDALLTLAVVHPVTLANEAALAAWQAVAINRRLLQPFRQLFREVYLPTTGEEERCARFAGLQIHPGRAYALLRAAGFAPGNGVARRDMPGGLTAHLCWAAGAVGHDLFGPRRLPEVRTGDIWFTRQRVPVFLDDVPPVFFSETLRAADLLVTRAAVGDAELTSRETVVLRATLLREVARGFSLANIAVREEGPAAFVFGCHATYRVNLASGSIFLEPEGRQIVLPPLDARWQLEEGGDSTSDILAIVLALAHDGEIADLTFLAQLPAPGPATASMSPASN